MAIDSFPGRWLRNGSARQTEGKGNSNQENNQQRCISESCLRTSWLGREGTLNVEGESTCKSRSCVKDVSVVSVFTGDWSSSREAKRYQPNPNLVDG